MPSWTAAYNPRSWPTTSISSSLGSGLTPSSRWTSINHETTRDSQVALIYQIRGSAKTWIMATYGLSDRVSNLISRKSMQKSSLCEGGVIKAVRSFISVSTAYKAGCSLTLTSSIIPSLVSNATANLNVSTRELSEFFRSKHTFNKKTRQRG